MHEHRIERIALEQMSECDCVCGVGQVRGAHAQAARNNALVEKSLQSSLPATESAAAVIDRQKSAAAAITTAPPVASATGAASAPVVAPKSNRSDAKHKRNPSLLSDADHEMLDVLNHPIGLEHVIQFLSSEYREEHIRFWVRARDFRTHPTPDRARSIFNDYVAAGAEQHVQLDSTVAQKLKVCVDKELAGNTMLWMAKAQRNVEIMLRNDAFKRFKESGAAWTECVAEMTEFNKRSPDLVPRSSAATTMERLNKVVAAYGPTTELLDVINHPLGLEYFGHFLKSDFSEENLKFWVRVQDFKSVHPPSKQIETAKQIYNTFLKPGATQQVSIDSKSLVLITKAIDNGMPARLSSALLTASCLLGGVCF
jgi:hypothetical protein